MAATVLTGDSARRAVVRPFQLSALTDHADALLRESRAQAEELLRDARVEADRLVADARTHGFDEGFDNGKREGADRGYVEGREQGLREAREHADREFASQHEQLVDMLKQVLGTVDGARKELVAAAQRDVLVLAVAIAERITKRAGQLDPNVAVENVKAAVELVSATSELVFRVHPRDMATLQEAAPALAETIGGLERLHWVEDPDVTPGGCLIRMAGGEIDATLETQLQQIITELIPDDGGGGEDDSGE